MAQLIPSSGKERRNSAWTRVQKFQILGIHGKNTNISPNNDALRNVLFAKRKKTKQNTMLVTCQPSDSSHSKKKKKKSTLGENINSIPPLQPARFTIH
jgi:hypothetical protein